MDSKIIDNSRFSNLNLFKLVFIRNEESKKQIGIIKWIKLTVLETIFGAELLENIVNSSASSSERNDKCQYGKEMKLNSLWSIYEFFQTIFN